MTERWRDYLMFPVGSHGDVHPFVGLGKELRRRGHRVRVYVSGHFREMVERAGLSYEELGTAEDFRGALGHPDLWKAGPASMRLMAQFVGPLIRRQYELIAERAGDDRVVVVAGALALGSRVAQEKFGIPTASVQLSPASFRSEIEAPVLGDWPGGLLLGNWQPRWLKRAQWRAADWLLDRYFAPVVNEVCEEAGVKRAERIFRDWWLSPRLTLGMFPAWYARPQADWPGFVRLTGFPLYDEADVRAMDDEASAFFEARKAERRAIVLTAGSANVQARRFFEVGMEAGRMLGRPVALLTGHREQLPRRLRDGCRHFDYLPLSQSLPRAGAIVHHGGIGTTAQALRAGCPQVVMPMAYDQFDNAARVGRLGVGETLRGRSLEARELARILRRLTTDQEVSQRCAEVAGWFEGEDGIAQAAEVLESAW